MVKGIIVTDAWENIVKRLDDGIVIKMTVAELDYLLGIAKSEGRIEGGK